MPSPNAAPLTSLGGYRKREQAAKDRREANKAAPDVREIRAAVLARREAALEAVNEAETHKAVRPGELYRETLNLVPDGLLEELERSLPNLSTRQMADIVADVLRTRRRAQHAADLAVPAEEPEKVAKGR